MIDAAQLFSTKILTSKDFLKLLYGIAFVNRGISGSVDPCFPGSIDPCFRVYINSLSSSKIEVISPFPLFPKYRELKAYLETITALFEPHSSVNAEAVQSTTFLATSTCGAKILFAGIKTIFLHIDSMDISLQFASARERLGIPQYLASMVNVLDQYSHDSAQHLKPLLEGKWRD
jgi:hypothetical protein